MTAAYLDPDMNADWPTGPISTGFVAGRISCQIH